MSNIELSACMTQLEKAWWYFKNCYYMLLVNCALNYSMCTLFKYCKLFIVFTYQSWRQENMQLEYSINPKYCCLLAYWELLIWECFWRILSVVHLLGLRETLVWRLCVCVFVCVCIYIYIYVYMGYIYITWPHTHVIIVCTK